MCSIFGVDCAYNLSDSRSHYDDNITTSSTQWLKCGAGSGGGGARAYILGVGCLDPLKICRRGQSMF